MIVETDKIVIKTPREPLSSMVKYLASIIEIKKLITPIKKNQKKKLTTYEKKLLKERFVVERTFGNLKKFRRINNRYEYKLKYFIGFIELSLLLMS